MKPSHENDAALITDLLAVLKKFVSGGHSVGAPEWQVRLFDEARAVIKKAEECPR